MIFFERTGEGPPLLLLHGFPETHLMWRRVAPALAANFTVIGADLPGYGASGPIPSYDKSTMARELVRMMDDQEFSRFSVAGHDRGGRVAYRMALDHPDRIDRIAVLDIVPTSEVFARADARFALAYWPWSLLAQPEPLPERLILGDPVAIVENALASWGSDPAAFPDDVRAAYAGALRDPATVHAICEEYRAAATIDRERDEADRAAGRRITAPLLALWSENSALDEWYADDGGPLGIWRAWATDVRGRAIRGGHFFAEANAEETVAELRAFFLPAVTRTIPT